MRMEHQVVSFDLSNQIKEMGLPQNGIFAWYRYENQKPFVNLKDFQNYIENENLIRDGNVVSPNMICDTPTVAELGEILPIEYRSYYYDGYPSGGTWMCNDNKILGIADAKTEADARAKMWIILKKENIIK